MYHILLRVPHADKRAAERVVTASCEDFTFVRPAFLSDGAVPDRAVRVGVEDPEKGVESKAVGYGISREDVGRWIFENVLRDGGRVTMTGYWVDNHRVPGGYFTLVTT
ncbi:hypothetical protein CH063_10109 [Colletotrichum higginsianum]|uniref:NAD(P)-binding domain-containing protein n=1 Tax=Colletotrichum higginsianum (strain IMI 349063) TaxID=759273 RepID=H1VG75_COLHI|nr:hypothetical protein CH063_10109 [Colletotrichum higginsianum]